MIPTLEFTGWLAIGWAGMLLAGLLLNLLFFPEMWVQPDVPRWIRWLADRIR
jgi:hypothetical protein